MSPDDIAVRAADSARSAAALNPAPYWVVAAVPGDGQPWINVVDAFQREDDARARLARLSIAPRLFAGVYANDGSGNLTLIDLWGPEYRRYQTRVDDTRGSYGNKIARIGAAAPGDPPSWTRGARWGGLAESPLGLVALGAAALGVGYFVIRPGLKMMKADRVREAALKTKTLSSKSSDSGQHAYWDAYTARHRQ